MKREESMAAGVLITLRRMSSQAANWWEANESFEGAGSEACNDVQCDIDPFFVENKFEAFYSVSIL